MLRYGTSSAHLRDSVAGLCHHLCNSIVPWDSVRALVAIASHLIALDKCPGVRPIGIGETLLRIIGKAVCLATRLDATWSVAQTNCVRVFRLILREEFSQLLPLFDSKQQRAISRAKDGNISAWLSVLPLARSQFDLLAQEFRDGLALRYRKPLLSLSSVCDGCGAPLSIEHALDCRFGGLVTRRHNEVRDAFGELASLFWSPVVKEPVVNDGSAGSDTLIADLCVHGVWEAQTEALFDIRVIDTDARSYCTRGPKDVLGTAEGEKKHKYLQVCQDRRATFTPL